MNKIIITFIIINTFSFAELSKEQLLEYSNIAWGIKIFKEIEKKRYNNLFIQFDIDRNMTNLKKIEEMKKFAYCQDASKAFFNEVRKITNEEYSEIISFYQSDIGKKLNQKYIKYSSSKIKTIYQKLEKEKKFSKKKYLLIALISKELNMVELKIQYELRKIMTQKYYETNQHYSDKYLKEYAITRRAIVEEYEHQKNIVIFSSFTINELEHVLKYAKTNGAKREMEVLFKGMEEAYTNRVFLCSSYVYNFINMPDHE